MQISYEKSFFQTPNTDIPVDMHAIYFPLEWISAVAEAVAAGMDRECKRQGKAMLENLGMASPNPWWREAS